MARADWKGGALAAHAAPGTNEITERELESGKAFLEFREAHVQHLTLGRERPRAEDGSDRQSHRQHGA